MDTFDVRPGEGIGPIAIGMTRLEALEAAKDAGLSVMSFVKSPNDPEALAIEQQLFAYFDRDDWVVEVEVAVPTQGNRPRVMWGGLDFAQSPNELTKALEGIAQPDRTDTEYPATSIYPGLGLSVW